MVTGFDSLNLAGIGRRFRPRSTCLAAPIDVPWLAALMIFVLSVAVRVGDLDAMVNVDMYIFWSRRIGKFIHGVYSGEFANTVQSHHPGVTFMWSAGLLWRAFGVVDAPLDPLKVRLAVWPVVCVGSLFPVASYGMMSRLLGSKRRLVPFVVALLFATEPMLVAHSRNAHLDVLVTSFAWLAVLAALVAKRELSLRWAVVSGILLGFALLSKLSAAGYALGIAAVLVLALIRYRGCEMRLVGILALIAAVAGAVFVASWPAIWVSPPMVLQRLYKGLTTEVDKIGPFMFLGRTGKLDLPFWIYGVFVVYLVTPEFFLPGIGLVVSGRRLDPRTRQFTADAALASLPLVILVLKSNHVGTRYLIPMLPILGTLGAVAMAQGIDFIRTLTRSPKLQFMANLALPVLLVGRLARVIALYPLPITYCSSWTGVDCSAVFHIGWGEGMKEAARFAAKATEPRRYADKLTVCGDAYAAIMAVWTPLRVTKDLNQAHLLIQYLPNQQRRIALSQAIEAYVNANHLAPIREVKLSGRTYVTIYPGPRY